MTPRTRPAHTNRIGAAIYARDLADACTLLRWLTHRAPGLRTELEAGSRFPVVRLGCSQAEANELYSQFERGGRDAQESRDVLASETAWE